jgi:hypothetical protein
MIDVDAGGVPADHGALGGSISADGRFVAFWSSSLSLLGPGVSGSQVLVRDRQSGTNTLVSVDSQGSLGNGSSKYPMLSADGRFVAFESLATNLVAGDTNGKWDVFLHDCLTGATTCCDVNASGDPSDGGSWPWSAGDQPAISGDGRFVSFDGFGDDLVPGGSNGASQVYVHGPYLTLEADPPQVAAGATLTFTTWTGAASNLALLALIDIDGVPMFLPAAFSAFDTSGVWSLSVTVPPGLSGNVLTLQTYGFVPTGKVQASNQMAVAFQ